MKDAYIERRHVVNPDDPRDMQRGHGSPAWEARQRTFAVHETAGPSILAGQVEFTPKPYTPAGLQEAVAETPQE